MRLPILLEKLRGSLWFIPGLCVAVSIGLSYLTIFLDRQELGIFFAFGGQADGAREMLSAIASSMIGLTGIVFSVTIVVLQLASQQFSPRVLRTFLRDRHSQLALGVFIATFTYALLVLREVRVETENGDGFVPGLSVAVAFGLVILSLGFFVHYINHIAQAIRIATITRSIAEETHGTIERLFTDAHRDAPLSLPARADVKQLPSTSAGVLTMVDLTRLLAVARRCDSIVEICPSIGDFVPRGTPLIKVYGDTSTSDEELLDAVELGSERTMQQDPAFGFRQLVDIAERALSPGSNDPTTAVQCIDHLHDLLRQLAGIQFPSGQWLDEDGKLRVVLAVTTWEEYVGLACEEIRRYGRNSLQIHRRLRAMLEDLMTVALPERKDVLREQLTLLDVSAERDIDDPQDRAAAREPDASGLS